MDRRNYFEILGLDFDPPENNQRRIDKALAEWKKRTEDMLANETIASRRAVLSDKLDLYDDMIVTLRDNKTRNKEAHDLKAKRIMGIRKLLQSLPLKNNTRIKLSWDEICDLAKTFRLDIVTVRNVVAHELIEHEDKPQLINLDEFFITPVIESNIRVNLDRLKKATNLAYQTVSDLYDLLECDYRDYKY